MFENWDLIEMIFRATGTFLVLLLMARLMGRKELSQLTFFNYISGIALGSIAGGIAGGTSVNFLNGLTGLIGFSLLTIIVGFINLKSPKVRVVTDGQPVIVIKKGTILEDQLNQLRLNMDDLSMLLREQKVFSVTDVEHAILETNGKLSIMLTEEMHPVTRKDQNLATVKPKYIPMQLISDGEIVEGNLKEAGLSSVWLEKQLKSRNVKLEDVFYVELQKDGTLHVDKRNDS